MSARSGELAMRPLPAVLLDLHEDRATGRLVLKRGRVAKSVDLVRGNYIKLLFVLGLNVVALLTFYASAVEIDWIAGLAVTAGQILGAYFGSWVAIEKGERWIVALRWFSEAGVMG